MTEGHGDRDRHVASWAVLSDRRFSAAIAVLVVLMGCAEPKQSATTLAGADEATAPDTTVESKIGDGPTDPGPSDRKDAGPERADAARPGEGPPVPKDGGGSVSDSELRPERIEHGFPALAAIPQQPPVPDDNPLTPEKVALGRLLFFDKRLSGDGGMSCASCHEPLVGWGDGNDLSIGYEGTEHWRNSQTVVNTGYLSKLFWAGESPSLEAQAASAIKGNLAGNGDPAMIEERLKQIPEYVRRFEQAFGVSRLSFPLVLKAIASFERAELNSTDSPFDRYMRGDKSAMSGAALQGMRLFVGKSHCIRCHNGPLLTDESFHNLGVPSSPQFEDSPLHQISLRYQFYLRGVPESVYRSADRDLGLYFTTKREEDIGKFRTPPLRYLEYTDPYMHNGVFASLEEVIDFYDAGGGDDKSRSALLEPLGLTDDEKSRLLAFLQALSGSEIDMDEPELPPYEVMGDP